MSDAESAPLAEANLKRSVERAHLPNITFFLFICSKCKSVNIQPYYLI